MKGSYYCKVCRGLNILSTNTARNYLKLGGPFHSTALNTLHLEGSSKHAAALHVRGLHCDTSVVTVA